MTINWPRILHAIDEGKVLHLVGLAACAVHIFFGNIAALSVTVAWQVTYWYYTDMTIQRDKYVELYRAAVDAHRPRGW